MEIQQMQSPTNIIYKISTFAGLLFFTWYFRNYRILVYKLFFLAGCFNHSNYQNYYPLM